MCSIKTDFTSIIGLSLAPWMSNIYCNLCAVCHDQEEVVAKFYKGEDTVSNGRLRNMVNSLHHPYIVFWSKTFKTFSFLIDPLIFKTICKWKKEKQVTLFPGQCLLESLLHYLKQSCFIRKIMLCWLAGYSYTALAIRYWKHQERT
jgi:hypothetical protein